MTFHRRLAGAGVAAGAAVMAFAAPAFAHVTVDPSSAPKGAEITLGFRVPNEEAKASTTEIQIFFPSDHPVLGVDPQSTPGWSDRVRTATLNPPVTTDDGTITDYISEVDWYGGAIKPGHFQEFYVLAQQLPSDTNQVAFKALQTYSDGTVVRWIQPVPPGGPEPDHPTPILQLTNGPAATGPHSSGTDTTAVVGVVLGAIGLVFGGAALALVVRGRRGPAIGGGESPGAEAGTSTRASAPASASSASPEPSPAPGIPVPPAPKSRAPATTKSPAPAKDPTAAKKSPAKKGPAAKGPAPTVESAGGTGPSRRAAPSKRRPPGQQPSSD